MTDSNTPSRQDRLIVKDLLLRGIVGLNDWERTKRQDILVNLTLFTDIRAAGESDNADDILNYRTVTKAVIEHIEGSSYFLVEKLATEIAKICLRLGADRVQVRVEKPGALRFASSVGVEIEREPADFA